MNINSPEFLNNPYPFYAERRASAPVFRRNDFEWTITGFQELSTFLAKPSAGRGNIGQTPHRGGDTSAIDALKKNNPSLALIERWMTFQNPPKHTKTRGNIASVFTNKLVSLLEQSIRKTLRELLYSNTEQGTEFDFVSTVAYPFPLTVISDMLGIPKEDRTQFAKLTRSLTIATQSNFHQLPKSVLQELNNSAVALEMYFKELLPKKIANQSDDLMTRLINKNSKDLDTQELLANCVFLLFAGQDTTTCLLTNAMSAFFAHPEEWQKLIKQPDLIPNAVEECLRFDPSVQLVGRFALEDIEIENNVIKQGHHVFAFLGAAGRDPLANPTPDIFDVSRQNIKHLAFARGAHHCLGATLARLEIRIFIEEMLNLMPTIEAAGDAIRRPTWLLRGFDRMPVRVA